MQVHWSEDDMVSALDTVRTGTMSINQAAIHFHLPYSSLYGRINRYPGHFSVSIMSLMSFLRLLCSIYVVFLF